MPTTRLVANSLLSFCLLASLALPTFADGKAADAKTETKKPAPTGVLKVALETSKGKIVIQLFPDKAPTTVANFMSYVDAGFYNGTVFHRVIDGFMIQGGGFTADLAQKTPNAPIKNEADNGLKNDRGTVAMARTMQVDSATAQFFINTVDNAPLNHTTKTPQGWGYAVFAKVIEGMNVVDAISKVPTTRKGGAADTPIEPVVIQKAYRVP